MDERAIRIERAQNLWGSSARKLEPLARGITLEADPAFDFSEIGGLAGPKDEILTYACAATNPGVYEQWGTLPPSGVLLLGEAGAGKTLLVRALATHTETSFLHIDVPRLVLDVMRAGKKVRELIELWPQILEEMPPLTVFFDELEFSQSEEIGDRRMDLPVGPIMDFLIELIWRTAEAKNHLLLGATSHPHTLRPAFIAPGRFERIVEVTPVFPSDVIEALQIHVRAAEKRAGRSLFDPIDWHRVIGQTREPSVGDWVRILHAVLRRKARCDAAGEEVPPVTTADLQAEVERFKQARSRMRETARGNYL